MVIKNNALLIFDFDNTITNGHMHGIFSGKHSVIKKSDYNSAAKNAVTDNDIENFLKNTDGIKNEEGLKSALQSALSSGMEVNIASFTGYPNAVKKVVEDYLGLSKEQADNVSVFSGFPEDYDDALKGDKEQRSKVGKNLHICKAIVEYKNNHNGQLPKTVMLVDDDVKNIEKIKGFVESMSKREEWLKKNGLSIEEIQKIKFEGARVPQEDKNVDYLERVQEFVNANLVQELIYKNLKKEELPPPLPPKKRKLNKVHIDNAVVTNGIKAPLPYCGQLDLKTDMQELRSFLQKDDFPEKAIYAICNLFKEKVIEAIREQGDKVTEKSEVLYTESRHRHGNNSKITADSLTQIMAQVQEKKKEIKDLASYYSGNQLKQKMSELLNVNLQKENINSNYNDKELTHQTVQEAHQQKKNTNLNPASSTTPQASSSPPRSYIKEACSSQHIASIVKQPSI